MKAGGRRSLDGCPLSPRTSFCMFRASTVRWRLLRHGAIFACVACSFSISQDAATDNRPHLPAKTPVFKSSVRRVIVDVMVSDSMAKPVLNLTQADFSILEDGKPQTIRSFDIHNFDAVSDGLPKFPEHMPPNTFVNLPRTPERGPLYALLLDLLNIDVSDQPYARMQLWQFIRNKPPGTRFAVFVLSDRLYMVQGFTEDRNALANVIDPKNSHSGIPRIFLNAENFRPYISTPAMLAEIGRYLEDFPGHKNLIWLSGSFPSAIMPGSDPTTEALSITDQVKEASGALARAQIAVYPVDARGMVARTPDTGSPLIADAALNATYLTEEEIAHSTGGRALNSKNDLAGALAEATETGGRYYTLSYSPMNQNYDGQLRRIQVEVSKRSYRLDYRRSYYAIPGSTPVQGMKEKAPSELQPLIVAKPSDSLAANMQHGAPLSHQLLFRAHVYTVSETPKTAAKQLGGVETAAALVDSDSEKKQGAHGSPQTYQIDYLVAARYPALEVAAIAYDSEGKILNTADERVIEESAQIPAGRKDGAIYRVHQTFKVPVNASSVRLGVRDIATDNVGALEIKLPLPHEAENPEHGRGEPKKGAD